MPKLTNEDGAPFSKGTRRQFPPFHIVHCFSPFRYQERSINEGYTF